MLAKNTFSSDKGRVELLETLVNIPSITGSEGRLGDFLASLLDRMGFRVERQHLTAERFNVVATTGNSPRLLFCSHMDTVRPHFPFSRRSDLLFGRGVCDAKGSLTAMIAAAEELLGEGRDDIGMLFVVGEELDSAGAKKAAELDLRPDYIILGEPTGNTIAKAQKGTLVFQVRATGQEGHSACPAGPSAVHLLLEALEGLTTEAWGQDARFGETTLNIGLIEGGEGPNIVAGSAVAEGIFRVAGSLPELKAKLTKRLADRVELNILSSSEPVLLASVSGFDETVVAFGSDAPYLQKLGKVVLMGPGSIRDAHRPDEKITLTEISTAVENYGKVAEQLLAKQVDR